MSNQDIDELTRALKKIRLEREKAIEILDNLNKRESDMLTNLHEVRAASLAGTDTCPFVIGDIIMITNHLRDKYGRVGEVKKIGKTLVTIVNSSTRRKYWKSWKYLALIESAVPPSQSK